MPDKIRIPNQLLQCTDAMIPTPCTQGCLRTWAALRRRVASRTNSLDIRSLAPAVMWDQSFSGNSYFPCWILSNRLLWGERITQCAVKLLSCRLWWKIETISARTCGACRRMLFKNREYIQSLFREKTNANDHQRVNRSVTFHVTFESVRASVWDVYLVTVCVQCNSSVSGLTALCRGGDKCDYSVFVSQQEKEWEIRVFTVCVYISAEQRP